MVWAIMIAAMAVPLSTAATLSVPSEDYAVYDRVIASKFLTSETELVVIASETATSLDPYAAGKPVSRALFAEQEFFDGRLPASLVTDFVMKNQQPARLARRFAFGISYRLMSPDGAEPIAFVQAPPQIGLLTFSRVAYSQRRDEALVYVAESRPDGTGGGLLVWLRREGDAWMPSDTEVIWTVAPDRPEVDPDEAPR